LTVGPLAAESGIENLYTSRWSECIYKKAYSRIRFGGSTHESLLRQEFGKVAGAGEPSIRLRPGQRIRLAAGDIRWDFVAWEEPDRHPVVRPFCRVNTTAIAIERGPKDTRSSVPEVAPLIIGLTGSVDEAVIGDELGKVVGGFFDDASFQSVDRHDIEVVTVDALNDVDFAIARPVRTDTPAV
jgi:hypothetical protein